MSLVTRQVNDISRCLYFINNNYFSRKRSSIYLFESALFAHTTVKYGEIFVYASLKYVYFENNG
jgi:hypothetical protein